MKKMFALALLAIALQSCGKFEEYRVKELRTKFLIPSSVTQIREVRQGYKVGDTVVIESLPSGTFILLSKVEN